MQFVFCNLHFSMLYSPCACPSGNRNQRLPEYKTIYTIGTSTRGWEEFRELVKSFGIIVLADVRRFPQSRFEHFHRENLARLCQREGLSYLYLGKDLGGYRKGGYEAYTKTQGFKEGIEKLKTYASRQPTAILCAERFPWRCHRRFIARRLEEEGWEVVHIIEKERVWIPKGKEERQVPLDL